MLKITKCLALLILLFLLKQNTFAQRKYNKLIWSEEFNYNGAPDSSKWTYDIGGNGWGNNELEYYTDRPQNVVVKNGMLNITVLKEDYKGSHYTSHRFVIGGKIQLLCLQLLICHFWFSCSMCLMILKP